MNTETNTLHGIATRRFVTYFPGRNGNEVHWVEVGEPVEVRETRHGKFKIAHRASFSVTSPMDFAAMAYRVEVA